MKAKQRTYYWNIKLLANIEEKLERVYIDALK